ncbi:MAG: hypothetical protein GY861_08630 [bacterium]|nr:hypothetical protein [bacterium]
MIEYHARAVVHLENDEGPKDVILLTRLNLETTEKSRYAILVQNGICEFREAVESVNDRDIYYEPKKEYTTDSVRDLIDELKRMENRQQCSAGLCEKLDELIV